MSLFFTMFDIKAILYSVTFLASMKETMIPDSPHLIFRLSMQKQLYSLSMQKAGEMWKLLSSGESVFSYLCCQNCGFLCPDGLSLQMLPSVQSAVELKTF